MKKTKGYVHCECDLYACPSITTSHKRTEDDIVCKPQLHQGRLLAFCISPSSVRTRSRYYFPQTLNALRFLWISFTHSTYPTHASPYTKSPIFSSSILPSSNTLHMPFFFPSLWSSKMPMLSIWKHLYIYSISTLLPPRQSVLCVFHPRGWMTYILSLAPCSHSSPPLYSVLLISHWPRAAAVGVAARLNWNGFCKHRLPFRAIYLGCLGHTEFQK